MSFLKSTPSLLGQLSRFSRPMSCTIRPVIRSRYYHTTLRNCFRISQSTLESFRIPKPSAPPRSRSPQPEYEMTFTCTPCSTRSTHRVSKQGYHHGSVLITCPQCKNRHVIADHLKIFGDKTMTIEDLMREKGQLVRRGSLNEGGDLELWDDGDVTERKTQNPVEQKSLPGGESAS